jgi:hypothetical protein
MAGRKKIPQSIQDEVITRSGRKCCLCFGINSDRRPKKGQIAHLDQNPENNAIDNLAWLCLEHHDEYDSRTSQSKGLTIGEVKRYREELYEAVGRDRRNALPISKSPPQGKAYTLVSGLALIALVILVTLYLVKSPQKDNKCDQPITTATATIEVTVASDEDINTTYIASSAYLAFGKGSELLLMMSSRQCSAKQTGNGQVVYRAVVNMEVSDAAFGKPMRFLEEAEYIQLSFLPMPEQSRVVTGKITGIFNGETVLEMSIPAQETTVGKIFVRSPGLKCGSS